MSELGHPSWGPELGPEHYRKTQFTRVRRVRARALGRPPHNETMLRRSLPLVGRAARAGPLGPVRLPRPNTCPRRLMGGGGSNHAPGVEPHFHISPWHKHGVRPAPRVAVGERALARFRGRAKSPSRPRITRASRPLSTARAPAPLDAQGTFYMTLMFLWVFYRAKEDGAVMLGLIHPWDAHGGHGHGDHGHDDEEHEEDEEEEE